MQLHHWHSSSTSFRVRAALALKGIAVETIGVELRFADGDHDSAEYGAFNPQRNVPVLVDGETRIMQSLAIVEYLEEKFPTPPLYPRDLAERARVRSLALFVACEIQALTNLRTQRFLVADLQADQPALVRWQRHFIGLGFDALERQLAEPATGRFCHGDTPTVADCFLVPQVYNSQRPIVALDLSRWPTIARIYDACLALPAFERSLPKHQPGFESPKEH
jgi:maleylacetoacetate isomerase/maleylpyruvate isomerase